MRSRPNRLLVVIVLGILIVFIRCAPDAPFKSENTTIPEQLNDGWQIAAPADVNISQAALDRVYSDFISEDRYFNALSLLIVKNGSLVFETYCRSLSDRDHFSHIQSATKSVTSLAFGLLLSGGYIDSVDQTLYSIIPDKFPADPAKRSITFRHLLTMTSGISFDNDDFSVEIHSDRPDDPIRYILNKPMYGEPGAQFYYRDCDPHLVSYTIERLTGESEEQWVRERIFDNLAITNYYWGHDHRGTTMGAYGLHLRPRDLAKIGQMVLDHGRWNSVQVIDSAWVAESTRAQIQTDWNTDPHVYDYGFYWWIVPRWHSFTAWGQGGNFIFVVPDSNMVIVMTSMPDVDDDEVGTKLDDFEDLVAPLFN